MLRNLIILIAIVPTLAYPCRRPWSYGIYGGVQHVRHFGCTLENPEIHRGYGSLVGGRLFYALGRFKPNFRLNYTDFRSAGEAKYLFRNGLEYNLSLRYDLLRRNGYNIYVESGLSTSHNVFEWPTEIGVVKRLDRNLVLDVMFRSPNALVVSDAIGTFDFISYRLEIGLIFNLGCRRICHGPPTHENTRFLWE